MDTTRAADVEELSVLHPGVGDLYVRTGILISRNTKDLFFKKIRPLRTKLVISNFVITLAVNLGFKESL